MFYNQLLCGGLCNVHLCKTACPILACACTSYARCGAVDFFLWLIFYTTHKKDFEKLWSYKLKHTHTHTHTHTVAYTHTHSDIHKCAQRSIWTLYANTTIYVSMHFIFILCRTYEKEDADLCAHYVYQHLQYSRMHACTHTHTHTHTRTHTMYNNNKSAGKVYRNVKGKKALYD